MKKRLGMTAPLVARQLSTILELELGGKFTTKYHTVNEDIKMLILTRDRVTWRTRDGFEGEGLTEPLLSTWEIDPNNLFGGGPMKEWDVTALAIQYEKATRCGKGIAPLKCDNGPFICRFVTGNENIQDSRKKKWSCGIPIKGEKSLDTLELPKLNG